MKKTLLLGLFFLILISCKDRDSNCGCDSETKSVIPESRNFEAIISYNTDDNYYNNKFWLSVNEGAVYNYYIICNESILPSEVLKLKETGETLRVNFSGETKEICEKNVSPANYSYNQITLTKIQLQ
ncbi:MAG: hypothetical protein Q4G16_02725 [Cruoricaptor ignavus]|nr:hypothetical protein [Cruoricaptor ignavus]